MKRRELMHLSAGSTTVYCRCKVCGKARPADQARLVDGRRAYCSLACQIKGERVYKGN